MVDPIAARLAVEHDAVERQLVQLEARLISEFGGGVVVERMVRNLLADARQSYAGARVRIYLAIFIERDARRRLEQADTRGAALVDVGRKDALSDADVPAEPDELDAPCLDETAGKALGGDQPLGHLGDGQVPVSRGTALRS